MKKLQALKKIALMSLIVFLLSGCTFIVIDEPDKKYYGVDAQRGDEFLNRILDIQEQFNKNKVSK